MQYIPHDYQAYCIQRVVEDPTVGLFLRPGLGKTVITLSAVNMTSSLLPPICWTTPSSGSSRKRQNTSRSRPTSWWVTSLWKSSSMTR